MKLLIVLRHEFELWRAPEWLPIRLRQEFPQIDVLNPLFADGVSVHIRDAEIVVGWSLQQKQLASARNLRWIHSPSAAVDQLLFPELIDSEIVLTNGSSVNGPVVAEHVMAMILALAKNLPQALKLQARHVWGQQEMWQSFPRPREIAGATLGLVGLGSIGCRVAGHASGMGMRVIAVRENLEKPKPDGVELVQSPADLDVLLQQSDYVALTVPVTASTTGMMNAARFARMKPGACLINVGRGPLIEEDALLAALQQKQIAAAALDVFAEEPLPADSPLWDLENLMITPHIGGLTEKLWERQYQLISENLRRYINHEPLLAVVDKHKGY
jgi:phosphoglycerate dehydrogenase-like enzyme